ncbi:MAG: 16S rRNA pseudouridine(516) synthase [Clostridiales bacterium]|nr:16S rRNA pseudouridine(516) synthase [Clostridiales bacterium]
MKMRLDRWLATVSAGSRSEVKQWIRGGQAAVNGRVILDPALSFETEKDSLALNGKALDGRVMRHVMLHKPAGILTAARDAKQPTVMDLLPPVYRKIGCMPVGRLDKDTTGLLLLTCDGELNHRLLSPGRHVEKRYRALTDGTLTQEDAEAFAAGMDLGDFTAQPAKLTILGPSLADVVIAEGKFHQVKRMFEAVGKEVLELHRSAFGPLELDPSLAEGQWRELTAEEEKALREAAGMEKA